MSTPRKQRAQVGRPRLPADEVRSVKILFRVEPGLHERIVEAADRAGKPMATWIRETLEALLRSK